MQELATNERYCRMATEAARIGYLELCCKLTFHCAGMVQNTHQHDPGELTSQAHDTQLGAKGSVMSAARSLSGCLRPQ